MSAEKPGSGEIQFLKGAGPKRAQALEKQGLFTLADLARYFPSSYVDRARVATINSLRVSLRQDELFSKKVIASDINLKKEATVIAKVVRSQTIRLRGSRKALKLILDDGSGETATVLFWSYADFFAKKYPLGSLVTASGKPEIDKFGKITFNHPQLGIFDEEDNRRFREGEILPVYRSTESMKTAGINDKILRNLVAQALKKELDRFEETLSEDILRRRKFPQLKQAVKTLHFPQSGAALSDAITRMKYEEIFFFILMKEIKGVSRKIIAKGVRMNPKSRRAREFVNALPFRLTKDQKKSIREIAEDMESGRPMNRLLQGDVGSGKTVVALAAALIAVDNRCQAAFMAPTEILAEQHYFTIGKLLKNLDVSVAMLLGGQKSAAKREVLERISSGEASIVVGTHALFQKDLRFRNLGFAVIDEQHRFGVDQRAELIRLARESFDKDVLDPHILSMSATPIPRTLSLTVYGSLDISLIKEKPSNRKPVVTRVAFERDREKVYDFARKHARKGFQSFVVFPLVEESEKVELQSATVNYEKLHGEILSDLEIGLLHGQMPREEKESVMADFADKKYDVLVATTVIEVGIDVPNATVMIIENAERFGLATLHQLRGRVGRGAEQSYCILVTKDDFAYKFKSKTAEEEKIAAVARLKTMEQTDDGFEIAEVDLKLRGFGDWFGSRQSGLPDFKFLDIERDGEIIESAKKDAREIVANDPQLRAPENAPIRRKFLREYRESGDYFDIA